MGHANGPVRPDISDNAIRELIEGGTSISVEIIFNRERKYPVAKRAYGLLMPGTMLPELSLNIFGGFVSERLRQSLAFDGYSVHRDVQCAR